MTAAPSLTPLFQSPCGEKVLKGDRVMNLRRGEAGVSVPLRGKGFERVATHSGFVFSKVCFSPLAGKRF